MITVTQAYDTAMNKTVRLKTDIQIKANSNYWDLDAKPMCVWGTNWTGAGGAVLVANPINSAAYKRSIDPIGNELPMMSLEWEEQRTPTANEYAINAKKGDVIQVSYIQDIGGTTETVTLPVMFINELPTINDTTISWKAVDLITATAEAEVSSLYNYFNYEQSFTAGSVTWEPEDTLPKLPYIAARAVDDVRAMYYQYANLAYALSTTADEMAKKAEVAGTTFSVYAVTVDNRIIMSGKGWDAIKNVISCYGGYLDFATDGTVELKQFTLWSGGMTPDTTDFENAKIGQTQREISISTYKSTPKITKTQGICSYTINHTEWLQTQEEKQTEIINYTSAELLSTSATYKGTGGTNITGGLFCVKFDIGEPVEVAGYGVSASVSTATLVTYPTLTGLMAVVVVQGITRVANLPTDLKTACYRLTKTEKKVSVYTSGTVAANPTANVAMEENNPQNFLRTKQEGAIRFGTINRFSNSKSLLELEIMGDPSLECGDIIKAAGYAENVYPITEDTPRTSILGVITNIELNYSGYLSEKLTIHEWGEQS